MTEVEYESKDNMTLDKFTVITDTYWHDASLGAAAVTARLV